MIQQNKDQNRKESKGYCINLQKRHVMEDSEKTAESNVAIKNQIRNDLCPRAKGIDYYPAGCRETSPNLSNRFQRQRSSGEHKVKDVAGDVSDSSGTDIGS